MADNEWIIYLLHLIATDKVVVQTSNVDDEQR